MDDLELQNLKAVADAVPAVLDLLWSEDYGGDGRVTGLSDALNILQGGNIGNEHAGQGYDNGPWATVSNYDSSEVDTAGGWHFPGPDVTGMDERGEPNINIEQCGQGFLVYVGQDKLAFSNALDVAEWLVWWLGYDVGVAARVRDALAPACMPLREACDLRSDEYKRALGVAEAAQAFVEYTHPPTFDALREAVKKWRMTDSKESASLSEQIATGHL